MRSFFRFLLVFCALIDTAPAATNDGIRGAYLRAEVGQSHFKFTPSPDLLGREDHDLAVKFFAGYRFNENLGVEAGYVRLGAFQEVVRIGNTIRQEERQARSLFAAATARVELTPSLFLLGRLGVSAGKVRGNLIQAGETSLTGEKTSALVGLGIEYRPQPRLVLSLNQDWFGRIAPRVKARSPLLGIHLKL